MEPINLKTRVQKLANVMIIGMVIAGTIIFAIINHVSTGADLMPKLFLVFFGAIITVQVIPGLILLATMIKGILSVSQKKVEPAKATASSSAEK